jgi:hypothetical protein
VARWAVLERAREETRELQCHSADSSLIKPQVAMLHCLLCLTSDRSPRELAQCAVLLHVVSAVLRDGLKAGSAPFGLATGLAFLCEVPE